MPFNVVSFYI